MILLRASSFRRDYRKLPSQIQLSLEKALALLFVNPRHPSLQSRKLPGTDIWYARIDRGYRFTFQYDGDTMILRRAGTHAILSRERK